MTKARREIAESMPTTDLVIEVLDARMPQASANPVLGELRAGKPCVKVLTKSDLADPAVTKDWVRHLEAQGMGSVVAVAIEAKKTTDARTRVLEACARLTAERAGRKRVVRILVVGIPNVGKSTLINILKQRNVTRVGDEPAVTKAQQRVVLGNGMALSDNPGILWPKIDDEAASHRLALGGALPDVAIDFEIIGLFAAEYFLSRPAAGVMARYRITELPESPEALLTEIGKRRGCLRGGGGVDLHKAADILIHEFRAGKLGRISLEEPPPPDEWGQLT